MLDLLIDTIPEFSVRARTVRANIYRWAWLLGMIGLSGVIGLLMLRAGPSPFFIALLLFLLGLGAIFYQPRYGLYLILSFGLAGDGVLTPWFPFIKNFSSRESILFIHDSAIISPLEVYIAAIFISWLGRGIGQRKITFSRKPIIWLGVIFLLFVIFGLIYGIGTGGNYNIALWEARPLFYLAALLFLSGNLLEKREHVSHLIWAAMLGIFFEALYGTLSILLQYKGSLPGINALTDHSAAIHMNTVFVLAFASWIYKTKPQMRFVLTLMVPIVLVSYIANQRRAAMIALMLALALMAIILFMDNRKLFWVIIPLAALVGVVYLAAFWNSSGALGLPARAVKSTLFPGQASARDQSSNYYRFLENINTSFTIHQRPLTGVGFGQKFYVIVSMADISFFEWWQYFPHNSIIWIWLKTGVFGFLAMLYFVGSAIMLGTVTTLRMPYNELRAIALTATLYLVMHFTFAYVDISWDTQSMLYIGAMVGMLSSMERIVAEPVTLPPKRWPWQPEPKSPPGLIPFEKEERPREKFSIPF